MWSPASITGLLLAAATFAVADTISPPNSKSNPLRLWYTSAATYFNDSLPIGNGRLGGMVKGVQSSEIVYINEDSLWSGHELSRANPSAQDSLSRIQPWLASGDVADAQFEANLGICGLPDSTRQYQPGGDFQIVFQGQSTAKNYERWLDLEDGTAGVYYTSDSVAYQREYLSSNPAGVIAIRLFANASGSQNFYIKFQRPSNSQIRYAETAAAENGDTIITTILSGQISAAFGARVHIIGGTKRQVGDQIQVTGADEAWIYADFETTVRAADPSNEVRRKLAAAISSDYGTIRKHHVTDFQSYFNRTSLNLGASSDVQKALSTDQRSQALASGGFDPELVALYFQFGRYLLISSSRAGTYPPNLQGIWDNDMAPQWGSRFTININLEMNYWPAEVTNLQELTSPLWDLLETMYRSGTKTAKQMYNAGGWVAHHNTDIWGDSYPQDISTTSSYWPMGHVWLLSHVYEHYRFTGDEAFLRKYYYLLNDAAQFNDDFLSDYNGWKVTNPSLSPENSYKNGSISGSMTVGSTIDNSLLWELFGNLIEATSILKLPITKLISEVAKLRTQLPPLRVSPTTNVLMEWIADFTESDPGHRHMSPVYGLFPSNQITKQNITIWNAAQGLVDRRVANGGGSTGWSRAWISALYGRLYRGQDVQYHITQLLYNYTYNSLLDTGPPAAFQIDGNFGGCAAIAESLLQSQNGLVNVLPALMPSSTNGSFAGLVARGGFVVGATWSSGSLTNVTVLSRLGNSLNITAGTGQALVLQGGGAQTSGNGTVLNLKTTKAGATYTFIASARSS